MNKREPATTAEMWAALDVVLIEVEANRKGQVTEHQLAKVKAFQSEIQRTGCWVIVPFSTILVFGIVAYLCLLILPGAKVPSGAFSLLGGVGLVIFLVALSAMQYKPIQSDLKTLTVATVSDKLRVWVERPYRGRGLLEDRYYVGVSAAKRQISKKAYETFKTREQELFRAYFLPHSGWLLSLEPVIDGQTEPKEQETA
jgi:hypothetical protein